MTEVEAFAYYLKHERALSENSIQAYVSDLNKLDQYSKNQLNVSKLSELERSDLSQFLYAHGEFLSPRSLSRLISSIKSFYSFLHFNLSIEKNPSQHLQNPKFSSKPPVFLSIEEVDGIIGAVPPNDKHLYRNQAIIELLYSCGLRVSELCQLALNRVFMEEDFIQIIGKGNKERLVPLSRALKNRLEVYFSIEREGLSSKKSCSPHVFLNNRGCGLSRIMVFNIVKKYAQLAGLSPRISPHSFRHSFASHMIENGADLRIVQDLLGHESIQTTELYTHLNQSFVKKEFLEKHPRNSQKA
ncbi:MAG: tyrosine recombinase [Flavobacteriales bacterium]